MPVALGEDFQRQPLLRSFTGGQLVVARLGTALSEAGGGPASLQPGAGSLLAARGSWAPPSISVAKSTCREEPELIEV